MKKIINYILATILIVTGGCKKTLDIGPTSNLSVPNYYTTLDQFNTALTGCYNGLQRPLYYEWELTELRSDNSKQGVPSSTSSTNRDLSDLDEFIPSPAMVDIFNYWFNTYYNIRNVNQLLTALGVQYDSNSGANTFNSATLPISDADRKRITAEACFIRAYHYFNLVRLYGGVMLITTPITDSDARLINRSSDTDIYKLIEADLKTASDLGIKLKFSQIATTDLGRATSWAAKGLLAKMYLTQNRKTEAIAQLQDVITNSGYSLQSTYANVFSITNEVNSEILFAVRYKAGNIGQGSPFANLFGPLNSGNAVVNGNGGGLNTPTFELEAKYATNDARKAVNIQRYGSGATVKVYVNKYISVVATINDAENDWPVLRYADILLMLAEAQGFNASSVALINQVRARSVTGAGATVAPTTVADFELALSNERRYEFAFENQRFFDLVRFNTTLSTIKAVDVMKSDFAYEYPLHYNQYPNPTPPLADLQANIKPERFLLPIPQREIDNNTNIKIPQNPGY